MQFIALPWVTLQAIYRAKNGEVVEGKYVRVAGNFINLWDPSNESADRVNITPVFQMVFRNLDDGILYFSGRVMFFDKAKSEHDAYFRHPFDDVDSSVMTQAYAVTDTQYLAGTFYSGVVPN
ncbi:TPA: hypothetical protein QHO11_001783 [Klebsiella oxytoca]|uniref:hypothetical protein n=1 Tax=Klebsiella oxytoca TaxID=571 RepID=UPI0027EA4A96|nr:hypothetical protein [Klebsiella oxytoca]HDT4621468.1 hypothetical protein [Klebsiella oxytoca]